jgi:NAD+ synthase
MKTNKILNFNQLSIDISNWLKDYADSAGAKGYVIGVSGGVDSAVVSTLCAKTGLPLLVLEMPIHQDSIEVDRAQNHINWLKENFTNVNSLKIDLSRTYDILYDSYNHTTPPFGELIDKDKFDFSMANTRSRLRMTTLYQFAGMHNLLVAGTGNKVEDFGVYFFTKWGDGGVDISPIGDLMKSEVYSLGRELGIIDSILKAAPTDGLHGDGRTDEMQLGASYDELEWAMNHLEFTPINQVFGNLNKRQSEVLDIYFKKQKEGSHKSKPIPIFNTSHSR